MDTNTVIIGASAAGLASAACLRNENIPFILLERENQVGHAWRNHYDRLHLHTNKKSSGLPFRAMPGEYPKYPSRDQVVRYLEQYAEELSLNVQFGQTVEKIERRDDQWKVDTEARTYRAENVIMATGYNRKPFLPRFTGEENYRGQILHSSEYQNGRPFQNQRVLVVGFGNSACEIVLCLNEHGALPSMSVRGPVNIIPRDILGIPVLSIGIIMSFLPPKLADRLNAPIIKMLLGDYTQYGLSKPDYGPIEQIVTRKRIPLLDIGTLSLIKKGEVEVFNEIDHFVESGVTFKDGATKDFDAVILGTGYTPGIPDIFPDFDNARITSGAETVWPGLFFCGFYVSPTGMLREIGLEAKRIAHLIRRRTGATI